MEAIENNISAIEFQELVSFFKKRIIETVRCYETIDDGLAGIEEMSLIDYYGGNLDIDFDDENGVEVQGVAIISAFFAYNEDTKEDIDNAFEVAKERARDYFEK